MCYLRDLAFTTKVMLGEYTYNYSILDLSVDINSPVTHVNSESCQKCDFS